MLNHVASCTHSVTFSQLFVQLPEYMALPNARLPSLLSFHDDRLLNTTITAITMTSTNTTNTNTPTAAPTAAPVLLPLAMDLSVVTSSVEVSSVVRSSISVEGIVAWVSLEGVVATGVPVVGIGLEAVVLAAVLGGLPVVVLAAMVMVGRLSVMVLAAMVGGLPVVVLAAMVMVGRLSVVVLTGVVVVVVIGTATIMDRSVIGEMEESRIARVGVGAGSDELLLAIGGGVIGRTSDG